MPLTNDRDTSISRRLNGRLRVNPAYVELFEAVDRVLRTYVVEPRRELTTVRDPRRLHRGDWTTLEDKRRVVVNYVEVQADGTTVVYLQDVRRSEAITVTLDSSIKDRGVLVNGARYHGFNYFSDTLTDEDYATINEWVEYFWPESGSDAYVNFMGFIKHVRLDADVLWSSVEGDGDEYPFLEPNDGTMRSVTQGGSNFSTSHVQLRYDRTQFPDVSDEDLFNLFYLLAPIQLVLERIAYDIEAEALVLRTVVAASISLFESGSHNGRNPDGVARDLIVVESGGLSTYESGRMHLPQRVTLPVLHVPLVPGADLVFGVRVVGSIAPLQDARLVLRRSDGSVALDYRSSEGGRVWVSGSSVGVRVPRSTLPDPATGTWVLSVRSNYAWRDVLRGDISPRPPPAAWHSPTLDTSSGVDFVMPLLDGAVQVDPSPYLLYLSIRREDGTRQVALSTSNGGLAVVGGVIRVSYPGPGMLLGSDRTYTYVLYVKSRRGPIDYYAYAPWMTGDIETLPVLMVRDDGSSIVSEDDAPYIYQ